MPADLKLMIATFAQGQWDALKTGRVRLEGIESYHVHIQPSPYRRMVRDLEFDVAEIAFTTFLCAKSFGIPISGIPVFSNRDVHMSEMFYNVHSGIKGPRDLEGKRVGLRSYTVTNNTQCRALLNYELGIDTDKIRWVVVEDAHVAQYREPPIVEYAPEGKNLEDMLVAGEIDAGIQPDTFGSRLKPGGDIKPLLTEDERNEVGLRYYQRTGVYPIGHVMAIKDAVLREHPWVAPEIFRAFTASKDIYVTELDSRSPLTSRDRQSIRNRGIVGGDPLPFGLSANRKAVEAMIQMGLDQHIIPELFGVDGLFAHNTLDLE